MKIIEGEGLVRIEDEGMASIEDERQETREPGMCDSQTTFDGALLRSFWSSATDILL